MNRHRPHGPFEPKLLGVHDLIKPPLILNYWGRTSIPSTLHNYLTVSYTTHCVAWFFVEIESEVSTHVAWPLVAHWLQLSRLKFLICQQARHATRLQSCHTIHIQYTLHCSVSFRFIHKLFQKWGVNIWSSKEKFIVCNFEKFFSLPWKTDQIRYCRLTI